MDIAEATMVTAPGPRAVLDGFILASAAAYSIVGMAHIMLIWRARKNFFVAVRSPLLTCVFGVCVIARYISAVASLLLGGLTAANHVDMLFLPALWVAEVSIVFMVARLLVMYDPTKRPKYGVFTNERYLTRILVCYYIFIEVLWWSFSTAIGKTVILRAVDSFSLFPPLFSLLASTCFLWQLRDVNDLCNMSRDIRSGAIVLISTFPIQIASRMFLESHSSEQEYTLIAYYTFSCAPLVWIFNVRPVREILNHHPERRIVAILQNKLGHRSRVAIAASDNDVPKHRRRASCADSSRLAAIMSIDTLRAAFGEFCYKSLCGESFQFLEDIADFKNTLMIEAESGDNRFKGFGAYLAIVNDYIDNGSHSEVNINSKTKHDILQWRSFCDYVVLDQGDRQQIFSRAEKEILSMLSDNLLNKFMLSTQYKESANFS